MRDYTLLVPIQLFCQLVSVLNKLYHSHIQLVKNIFFYFVKK